MKSNKLFVAIVVSVLMLTLLSCSLLYQIKAADQLVKKAMADQEKTERTLKKADDFDSEIDSLKPTDDNASKIISRTAALKENVKEAKEDLDDAKKKLKEAEKLRLPGWYKNKYMGKLEDAIKEREDSLEKMEKMLTKAENYGKSVRGWYKGNNNIKQAALELGDFGDAIENENYAAAADAVEKARTAIRGAQTEFNNAASFVNIKIYSDARDAAGIYAQMIDPLQQMVSLTNQMANTPVESLTLDMVNSYLGQINSLSNEIDGIIAKGDAVAPSDVSDDGSIPQSGQDQLSKWRKENIKTFISKIEDALEKAEDLEDEASSIRTEEN